MNAGIVGRPVRSLARLRGRGGARVDAGRYIARRCSPRRRTGRHRASHTSCRTAAGTYRLPGGGAFAEIFLPEPRRRPCTPGLGGAGCGRRARSQETRQQPRGRGATKSRPLGEPEMIGAEPEQRREPERKDGPAPIELGQETEQLDEQANLECPTTCPCTSQDKRAALHVASRLLSAETLKIPSS
jgi:hypothetical protein